MNTRVGLLFGGKSMAHNDSIDTAFRVMKELVNENFDLVPIYLSKDNVFYWDASFVKREIFDDIDTILPNLIPISIVKDKQRFSLNMKTNYLFNRKVDTIDIALLCIHDLSGEEVALQGYLEMLGLPYGGGLIVSNAIGQDRIFSRQILRANSIEVVPWLWEYSERVAFDMASFVNQIKKLGYPVMVQTAKVGMSLKSRNVFNAKEAVVIIEQLLKHTEKVVVDKQMGKYQEFSCAYLGNRNYEKTSAIAKYSEENLLEDGVAQKEEVNQRRCEVVDVSEELQEELHILTIKICRLLDLQGVVKIDYYVSNDEKKILVKEINAFPSCFACKMFEAKGISLKEIIRVLLQNAILLENK